MPLSWKRQPAKKNDGVKERTERTANRCYQNRLRLKKPGDPQSDWETAEKIVQNPVRRLLFSINCLWTKFRPPITRSLIFSAVAVGFTWWLDYQAEIRQQTNSQNLNHQRILESYINNLKEISLSRDYNTIDSLIKQREFIVGMTLPVLRELTHDEARKAQLVLFLYQMKICGMTADQSCKDAIADTVENLDATEQPPQPEVSEASEQDTPSTPSEQIQQDVLQTADLKFANFRGYQLPNISFRGADLRGANLSSADLRGAVLTSANLSCHQRATEKWWSWVPFLPQATEQVCSTLQETDLQRADLSGTVFSQAILLRTDLREVQGLTQQQLEGENSPLLCNVGLPKEIDSESFQNRDCETIVDELHERYPGEFSTLKKAQAFVDEQKSKTWEDM